MSFSKIKIALETWVFHIVCIFKHDVLNDFDILQTLVCCSNSNCIVILQRNSEALYVDMTAVQADVLVSNKVNIPDPTIAD